MGKVIAVLKIIPDDLKVNLKKVEDQIKKKTPERIKFHDSKIEPFAYGLNVLKIGFVMNDQEGGTEELEEIIRGVSGVSEVEVEHVSLI